LYNNMTSWTAKVVNIIQTTSSVKSFTIDVGKSFEFKPGQVGKNNLFLNIPKTPLGNSGFFCLNVSICSLGYLLNFIGAVPRHFSIRGCNGKTWT